MPIRIVRLGTKRAEGEGLRVGTVRRPPRGVRKERYAPDDWFDAWLPELAPGAALVAQAQTAHGEADWARFTAAFRREMAEPTPARLLDLLAGLSHGAALSVGCYCESEARCHRSVLRALLAERGAVIVDDGP